MNIDPVAKVGKHLRPNNQINPAVTSSPTRLDRGAGIKSGLIFYATAATAAKVVVMARTSGAAAAAAVVVAVVAVVSDHCSGRERESYYWHAEAKDHLVTREIRSQHEEISRPPKKERHLYLFALTAAAPPPPSSQHRSCP